MSIEVNEEIVKVKQYVTNKKGNKVSAILDIKELTRIQELLEDLSDLKSIEERILKPATKKEAYR